MEIDQHDCGCPGMDTGCRCRPLRLDGFWNSVGPITGELRQLPHTKP